MNSHFYHVQLNIDFKNLSFYKELMTFLGWSIIFEMEGVCGFKSQEKGDVWFVNAAGKPTTDYDNLGLNHLAIRVEKSEDVDAVAHFLKKHSVQPLFDTPKHRPEFAAKDTETYYQVMFKSVDNLLFEVVYIGAK